MKTLGQIAFEAAAEATGCEQSWQDANQAKWEAAAEAVKASIAEWLEGQRNAIPATGEEFAQALRHGLTLVPHVYQGMCPDTLQPESRDPTCPACRMLGLSRSHGARA